MILTSKQILNSLIILYILSNIIKKEEEINEIKLNKNNCNQKTKGRCLTNSINNDYEHDYNSLNSSTETITKKTQEINKKQKNIDKITNTNNNNINNIQYSKSAITYSNDQNISTSCITTTSNENLKKNKNQNILTDNQDKFNELKEKLNALSTKNNQNTFLQIFEEVKKNNFSIFKLLTESEIEFKVLLKLWKEEIPNIISFKNELNKEKKRENIFVCIYA